MGFMLGGKVVTDINTRTTRHFNLIHSIIVSSQRKQCHFFPVLSFPSFHSFFHPSVPFIPSSPAPTSIHSLQWNPSAASSTKRHSPTTLSSTGASTSYTTARGSPDSVETLLISSSGRRWFLCRLRGFCRVLSVEVLDTKMR